MDIEKHKEDHFMEKLLHYIWEHKLYYPGTSYTDDGIQIEILDPGKKNQDAGPDFFNGKIRLGDQVWAGNIEIHSLSSDWMKHNHHLDQTYDSVILHVVKNIDVDIFRTNGDKIPQIELKYPEQIETDCKFLLEQDSSMPCADRMHELDGILISDWMSSLAMERLQQKTERIFQWLDCYNGSWEDVTYVLLSRNLGFNTNSDVFERLARSLPLLFMQKHADSLLQLEAFLFGQAGLLERGDCNDDYFIKLRNEYEFLSHKFNLVPLSPDLWKFSRMRPANFPHQRIAMLAKYIYHGFALFSNICTYSDDPQSLRKLFDISLSGYWDTHYNFNMPSAYRNKVLGQSAIDIILINTVAPLLCAYGIYTDNPVYPDRALRLLENLKSEQNMIIRRFDGTGLASRSALDSQAIIQLYKEYCQNRKCLDCRFGYKLLQKRKITLSKGNL